MASTLASITDRVEQTLADTSNVIWAAAAITEGIRSAMGEYNAAQLIDQPTATAVTLNGLDGAAVTTLPESYDTVIVWGAAAYCAQSRAIDRADSYQLGAKMESLKGWSDQRLRDFKAMLGAIFPTYLTAVAGSSGGASMDPALTAAQIAKLGAETASLTGIESRAAAAAVAAAAAILAEAARVNGLRVSTNAGWGEWEDEDANEFEGGKPE